jgi:vancomycin resistance protein YoaR
MRAEVGAGPARDRRRARLRRVNSRALRRVLKAALWALAGIVTVLLLGGVMFAGSSDRIPAGVSVAGIKLSGLTPAEAQDVLSTLAENYSRIPVDFVAAGRSWSIRPEELDVRVDWAKVVDEARAAGDAPMPLRGLKRLKLRLFGAELEPAAEVYDDALDFKLEEIAHTVAQAPREASIELEGLTPKIIPALSGRELDPAVRSLVVGSLAGFDRERVVLPVRVDDPEVTAAKLAPVAEQVRVALASPVRLQLGETRWRVRPKRLATFLVLPSNGRQELAVGGREAKAYFAKLARSVNRRPQNADFAVAADGSVSVVAARQGRKLDVAASEAALLAAALSSGERVAPLVVSTAAPAFTTAEANGYGITRLLSYYSTGYAGTDDRIHNLQLAVDLVNGTYVPPGGTFSLNDVVGERTVERGFRLAPVIVDGEYEEGVGGGVSQVATTAFNAAWEAGLPIVQRSAHALYIDRYPLGRDATVNFPDQDLEFTNDTEGWLLVRGGYDGSGISISILGPDTGRRVESIPGDLRAIGPPAVKEEPSPELLVGQRIVEDPGEPARAVSVVRRVYRGDELLYEETWSTTYRSEPKIVIVGTKPKPKPKPEPAATTPADEETPPVTTPAPADETAPTDAGPAAGSAPPVETPPLDVVPVG